MNDIRKFKAKYKPRLASRKDYSHEKTFGAAPLEALPHELLNITPILNQGDKPSCTAAASVAMRRAMTGKEYDMDAQFQLEIKYTGATDSSFGFPIDVAAKVGVEVGFVPVGQTVPTDKAGGYFWVTKLAGMDWFDTLRYTQFQLYKRIGKVVPFSFGINWFREWDNTPNGIVPDSNANFLGGHDTLDVGFQTYVIDNQDYIVNQGSWGYGFGDQGLFRFNRVVTNKNIGQFGIYYWLDKEDMPTEVQRMGMYLQILQNIKAILQLLVNQLKKPPAPVPAAPVPPPAPISQMDNEGRFGYPYNWDTPEQARHSVRLICDEEGLPLDLKNDLDACVHVESDYSPKAMHQNMVNGTVSSTDYGIVQVNDYFHIGPGKDFPSVDYVLANPEACVRWMAKLFKAGKANLWSSYQSGAYKKYL